MTYLTDASKEQINIFFIFHKELLQVPSLKHKGHHAACFIASAGAKGHWFDSLQLLQR